MLFYDEGNDTAEKMILLYTVLAIEWIRIYEWCLFKNVIRIS